MYLNKRSYVGAEYEHRKVTGKCDIKIDGKKLPIAFKRISYIEERIGYWRKANQIHAWFVANVQGGKDDCGDYDVSKENVLDLLAICKTIKEKCKPKKGKVRNGQTASPETGGKFVDNIEDGEIMMNSHVASKLLPSKSGFFFGSTDYDQYYMQDIDNTIEILEAVLAESDPNKDYFSFDLTYHSSW